MDQDLFNYYVNRTKELETAIKWAKAYSLLETVYVDDDNISTVRYIHTLEKRDRALTRLWNLAQ